jgi:hypothetical protein
MTHPWLAAEITAIDDELNVLCHRGWPTGEVVFSLEF